MTDGRPSQKGPRAAPGVSCIVSLLGFLGAALGGCASEGESGRTTYLTYDSAGIPIVESSAPLWTEDDRWSIAPTPSVVIGQVDGDERYLLHNVTGVSRFPDGRIAILDGGSSRVRIYGPEGGHLFDVGGPGDGPAELSMPQYLELVNDTIVVFEVNPPTITEFDNGGGFIGTTPVASRPGGLPLFGNAFGLLEGRALVIAAHSLSRPGYSPGRAREVMTVWRAELDGSRADSLAEIATNEIIVHPSGGWNDVPFGKTTYYAASDHQIYLGDSGSYSLRILSPDGGLEAILRRVHEPRPVGSDDVQRLAEQLAAAQSVDPERIPALARRLDELGPAETMPAFRMLVPDAQGNLWVEDLDDVGVEQGQFSVFSPEGVWLGRVELPPGLPWLRGDNFLISTLEIGDDYLLGVWAGEFGTEEVRLYPILKPTTEEKAMQ